jgi:hypothetical protein
MSYKNVPATLQKPQFITGHISGQKEKYEEDKVIFKRVEITLGHIVNRYFGV